MHQANCITCGDQFMAERWTPFTASPYRCEDCQARFVATLTDLRDDEGEQALVEWCTRRLEIASEPPDDGDDHQHDQQDDQQRP